MPSHPSSENACRWAFRISEQQVALVNFRAEKQRFLPHSRVLRQSRALHAVLGYENSYAASRAVFLGSDQEISALFFLRFLLFSRRNE